MLIHHRRKEDTKAGVGEILVAITIGATFGILADKLEPPTSPNHREFFHSVIFAAIAGWQIYNQSNNESTTANSSLLLKMIGVAYGSHLLLDAATPMGLPLL